MHLGCEGPEALPVRAVLGGQGHRQQRTPVKCVVEDDDAGPAGGRAGDLDATAFSTASAPELPTVVTAIPPPKCEEWGAGAQGRGLPSRPVVRAHRPWTDWSALRHRSGTSRPLRGRAPCAQDMASRSRPSPSRHSASRLAQGRVSRGRHMQQTPATARAADPAPDPAQQTPLLRHLVAGQWRTGDGAELISTDPARPEETVATGHLAGHAEPDFRTSTQRLPGPIRMRPSADHGTPVSARANRDAPHGTSSPPRPRCTYAAPGR